MASAVLLTLTSSGLLLLWRRRVAAAQWLAVIGIFMSMFALLGWVYAALQLHDIPAFSAVGLPSVAAFMLLSAGILAARGDQGIIAVFVQNRPGALMARRLWLPLIVLVIAGGMFVEWLRHIEAIAAGPDSAILVLWIAALSLLLVWFNARSLNRLDDALRQTFTERMAAEQTLRRMDRPIAAWDSA